MGRSSRKIGLGGVSAAGGSAPQEKFFFWDRLGYPEISMNLKTESFTYVILLINKKYMFFYTFGVNLSLDDRVISVLFSDEIINR